MPKYVVKLVGGVDGLERYPELMEQIGNYLVRYEPHIAPHGKQWLWTTPNPYDARHFDTMIDAITECRRTSGLTRPWDSKPDRPITVFHLTMMPL